MSVTSLNWRLAAACRDEAPALFFAPEGEHPDARQVREAKAKSICAGCSVRKPCLDFRLGFERQRDEDIWAGLNGDERHHRRHSLLKRQRRASA